MLSINENANEHYFIFENLDENECLCRKKAIDKKTGKFVALSAFKIIQLEEEEEESLNMFKNRFHKYIKVVFTKKHPAILKMKKYGYGFDNSINFFTISKFYKNGNIAASTKEYLDTNGQNKDKMNPLIRSKIIFGVASAMKYLHQLNCINENLTLENIILDDNFEPKIRDFSLYHYYGSPKCNLNESNYIYIAPELLKGSEFYTCLVDVYSFAFVIYKMFSNVVTFADSNSSQFSSIQYLDRIKNGERPIKPDLMPDCYWDLVTACFDEDFDNRPSFAEIVDFLKFDKFAIEEFGMKTDMEKFREYKKRISKCFIQKY